MIDPAEVTLGMQISEVQREIVLRRQVYPKLVGQGRMTQKAADLHIAAMEAALCTLKRLRDENHQL